MILERDQWHLGYASLLRDCRGTSNDNNDFGAPDALDALPSVGRALLLVHPDADAMASARILSYMLRADGVPYQLRPCMGWTALRRILGRAGVLSPAGQDGEEDDEEEEGEGGERNVVEGESDVRAVVLMNMGANRNLARLFRTPEFGVEGKSPVKCYVLDCHRPYHLANVHAGKNVVLFNDRPFEDGEVPSDGDDLSGDGGSSSESESDSDDSESDDEAGPGGRGRDGSESEGEEEFELDGEERGVDEESESDDERRAKRQRRDVDAADDPAREADEGAGLDDLQDSDDDDDGAKKKKDAGRNVLDTTAATADLTATLDETLDASDDPPTQTQSSQPVPLRELRAQRRRRVRLHYASGSYHASPSSWTAYTLARQLRFGDAPDLLWLACVGVADAHLHGRLDVGGYAALTVDLKRHVARLFPNELVDRAGRAVYAEELEGADGLGPGGATRLQLSENGRIVTSDEYKFMLLRHTSLWDALLHSDYVASRLQVWTGAGRRRLMELLARMGFPLDRCRQPWAFVGPKARARLKGRLEECAEEYGLENVSYTGFVRCTGYRSLLSASDMSYAVTALLECSAAAMDGGQDAGDDALDEDEREDRETIAAFNVAFDALNSNGGPSPAASGAPATAEGGAEGGALSSLVNGGALTGTTGLGAGLRLAMTLQRTVMSAARNLVDRNAITRLSHFRYAYLHCSGGGGAGTGGADARVVTPDGSHKNGDAAATAARDQFHVFAKPLVLARLARFLADVHRENGRWTGARARPLVLLAEKPRAGSYVVAGYECPEEAGSVVKNGFGQNFALAAKSMRGSFRFDGFDSNVVEVAAKDVQKFLEQLHYLLEQA